MASDIQKYYMCTLWLKRGTSCIKGRGSSWKYDILDEFKDDDLETCESEDDGDVDEELVPPNP